METKNSTEAEKSAEIARARIAKMEAMAKKGEKRRSNKWLSEED